MVFAMTDIAHKFSGRAIQVIRDDTRARNLMLAASTVFIALAALAVTNESALLRIDSVVQATSMENRTSWLNTGMVLATELGTRYVIGALLGGIAIWAWATKRCPTTVAILIVAFAVNPAFEILFKELVGRVRPDLDQLLPGNGPSFPSGHVLASVGFYGVIPMIVWESTRKRGLRTTAFLGSIGVIVLVGATRVYLDVHWTTDVLAGWMLGIVLIAATYHALRGHSLNARRACCGPKKLQVEQDVAS